MLQTYHTKSIRFERYKTYDLSVSNIKHIVQVSPYVYALFNKKTYRTFIT